MMEIHYSKPSNIPIQASMVLYENKCKKVKVRTLFASKKWTGDTKNIFDIIFLYLLICNVNWLDFDP